MAIKMHRIGLNGEEERERESEREREKVGGREGGREGSKEGGRTENEGPQRHSNNYIDF